MRRAFLASRFHFGAKRGAEGYCLRATFHRNKPDTLSLLQATHLRKLVRKFVEYDSNLVDPASSHMLVLKIKPCMSKYK